jgi:glutamine phosphoribosylpyrophosphate amidotransferase
LSIDGLKSVMGDEICAACFDGDYVVPISDNERSFIMGERR